MKANRKYLVAVALLAALAVAFGLAGTATPMPRSVSPQSSSDSVAHFQNPPTYNSSWLDITDKAGQYFNVTHNLNRTDVIVDITGRITTDGGTHQKHFGGAGFTAGWNRTYGGTQMDVSLSVVQTGDGGYAIVGYTDSYGAGNYDFWLVKTDAAGNEQWNQTYGGPGADCVYSLVQTSDRGYAITGWTQSYGAGGQDCWLVKTDSYGNAQWNKTYGGTGHESGNSVIQTFDGGYAIACHTTSYGAGNYDCWLVKTDSDGNSEWSQTYGGGNEDHAHHVIQTSDGGYAIAGRTWSSGVGDQFWLIKTNSSGDAQWDKTFGGSGQDIAMRVAQTSDGYAIAGYTNSFGAGSADCWLVKTNQTGNMQWSQTYGGGNADCTYSMVQTSDGGYALASWTQSFGAGGADFWLIKANSAGNVVWNKTYGGASDENAWSIVEASDAGYAIAGWTQSYGVASYDIWLIKTDAAGNARPGFEFGLAWTDSTADNITLYRGTADPYWNHIRVRIWTIEEPTWQFGDINMDGVVDAKDLTIIGKNYGKTFSALSLGGIIAIAGIYTYKKRKQPK